MYNDALDETGTVTTAGLTNSDDNKIETEHEVPEEVRDIDGELLKVHGVASGKKAARSLMSRYLAII